MELDPTKTEALDAILERYVDDLREAGADNAAVTLGYTHSLHRFWRQLLRMLPVQPGSDVLDMGSGLGILGFDLAVNVPVRVRGVDIDAEFIEHSNRLASIIAGEGLLSAGAGLGFSVGDVCALDLPEHSFDLVFIREVLQFVPDPVLALRELFRVLRPGGYICVSDMDDALRITWPPPSPALDRLVTAVAEVQHEGGGDRQIGRKLTAHLRSAGFGINSIVVLPEAQHRVVDATDVERALIAEQLHTARRRVLAADAMSAEEFDRDLAEVENAEPFEEFRLNAKLVVLAQRPAEA